MTAPTQGLSLREVVTFLSWAGHADPWPILLFVVACHRAPATGPEGVPVHVRVQASLATAMGLDSLGHLLAAAWPRPGAGWGSGGLAGSQGR